MKTHMCYTYTESVLYLDIADDVTAVATTGSMVTHIGTEMLLGYVRDV